MDSHQRTFVSIPEILIPFPPFIIPGTEDIDRANPTTKQKTVYLYSNIPISQDATVTLGISGDDYDQNRNDVKDINPKIGLVWKLTSNVSVRTAAFRTTKPALVADTTIQPTQIAGFNQFFDDVNATKAWLYGAGLDARITDDLSTGVEASRRNLSQPTDSGTRADRQESLYRAYVYWTPNPEWAFSSELVGDLYEANSGEGGRTTNHVRTWRVPASLVHFSRLGWFAGPAVTYVYQDVEAPGGTTRSGNDGFVVIDAIAGYRFPNRLGVITIQGSNLSNEKFRFQDDSFRTANAFTNPTSPFIPERTILARLTLSW